MAARRVAAGALVVLAAVAALRSDPQGDRTEIVVAARDLAPGAELSAADLHLETARRNGSRRFPVGCGPPGGSTLAGPARRGEVLTDVRLRSEARRIGGGPTRASCRCISPTRRYSI